MSELILETSRLSLRPLSAKDIEEVYSLQGEEFQSGGRAGLYVL